MPPRRIYEHSGSAELVLEGENLTPDTLRLYHNGVLYTPLESSDTYAYYLLGDNGTNNVMLNGKTFCTVNVKDIIVPEGLPTRMQMWQTPTFGSHFDGVNTIDLYNVKCINYPYKVSEELPYYDLRLGTENQPFTDIENFVGVNCSLTPRGTADYYRYLGIEVVEPSKPAYITYKGFIIAVFNYHA